MRIAAPLKYNLKVGIGLSFGESTWLMPDSEKTSLLLKERNAVTEQRRIEVEKEYVLKQQVCKSNFESCSPRRKLFAA